MGAKLISYTKPTDELSQKGIRTLQDMVAYCARVSNPSNQMNSETSQKLIKYLIKHKHWSPLEMVSMCLELDTTRDIAHQIVRHRSFSFQEFSQRYANPDEMGEMFTYRECRLQDKENRQNSIEITDNELKEQFREKQEQVIRMCKEVYDWSVFNGIAKEQARVVLPEGLTKTRLYMNGTLRSWVHYINLRIDNGTQKEHRVLAQQCLREVSRVFSLIGDII